MGATTPQSPPQPNKIEKRFNIFVSRDLRTCFKAARHIGYRGTHFASV